MGHVFPSSHEESLRALDLDIQRTTANADLPSTIKGYIGLMRQMENYFGRRLFQDPALEASGDVIIEPLTGNDLLRFLAHKRKENPTVKKGYLSSFKSAASKFRELNGFPPFTEVEVNLLKKFLKGVRNQNATEVRRGNLEVEFGHRHIKFTEYRLVLSSALKLGIQDKFRTELHLGMCLAWNLCARHDTVMGIHSLHLDWEDDSLKIGIGKSKRNYQEDCTFFHVYCNPFSPSICPVLSLALHCICNPNILTLNLPLFHDSKGTILSKNLSALLKMLSFKQQKQ
jgi:hypothetical protein